MSFPANRFARAVALLLLIALSSPAVMFAQKGKSSERKVPTPTGAAPSELIYAVTTTNNLISFNAANPALILSNVAITGLQAGENILGIDFRPLTRQLFGLGSTSRLYSISRVTGVATAVNGPFTPVLSQLQLV